MNSSSLGGKPQVERVDDARTEEPGVPQLEEVVVVQGHHREAVALIEAKLIVQGVSEPEHPVRVLGVRRREITIDGGEVVCIPLGGRQQRAVVNEVLHRLSPAGSRIGEQHRSDALAARRHGKPARNQLPKSEAGLDFKRTLSLRVPPCLPSSPNCIPRCLPT